MFLIWLNFIYCLVKCSVFRMLFWLCIFRKYMLVGSVVILSWVCIVFVFICCWWSVCLNWLWIIMMVLFFSVCLKCRFSVLWVGFGNRMVLCIFWVGILKVIVLLVCVFVLCFRLMLLMVFCIFFERVGLELLSIVILLNIVFVGVLLIEKIIILIFM